MNDELNDDGSYDELYPLEQRDWNEEQTRFKEVMREVVYHTQGIYFDGVQDTADEQHVYCNLWTQEAGKDDEWMRWLAISKSDLRLLNRDTLIAQTTRLACDMRDGKDSPGSSEVHGTPPQ